MKTHRNKTYLLYKTINFNTYI